MYSIQDIKRINAEKGFFFFEKETLRFFNSRVCADVFTGPGGTFFVTSEKRGPSSLDPVGGKRLYSVRQFYPATGNVETAGEFQGYRTASAAKAAARVLSTGGIATAPSF